MSSVVISNRNILDQKVNLEKNRVILPFNVSGEQIKKLKDLLEKTTISFLTETDNLRIGSLLYNGTNVKHNTKTVNESKMTLSKTYVVTMKKTFIDKVIAFYNRIAEPPKPPMFDIKNETNLQEALSTPSQNFNVQEMFPQQNPVVGKALEEATTEIDLSSLNAMKTSEQTTENQQPNQVLANDPLGETVINNPVNLNESNVQNQQEVNQVQNPTGQEVVEKKPKRFFLKRKGNVLAIPIVIIWLGLVLFGTVKLVTSILT